MISTIGTEVRNNGAHNGGASKDKIVDVQDVTVSFDGFKALNNLIEQSLLSREFVRLGKWFVQPFDGSEKPKSSHLSFSFSYFIHGESAVCASVDVREHAPVRRLTHAHLSAAGSLASTVQVNNSQF